MSNPYFQFKRFTVRHDKCAMRVGTDGVLLGAWANTEKCLNILDVGTGSGLIALMLAQRCDARIDALDIDPDACIQAKENIDSSPFKDRVDLHHSSLHEYAGICAMKYQLIVSNPPYFVNSMKCPDEKRRMARHTDTLPLDELIQDCMALLVPEGRIALIYPAEKETEIQYLAIEQGLTVERKTSVRTVPDASPKRILIELSTKVTSEPYYSTLTLEDGHHGRSAEYQALAKDFYLDKKFP